MHRKKKIPASFIIAFVISFIVSFSISRLIPKFVPAAARWQGIILFCGGLLLSFIAVAVISLNEEKIINLCGTKRRIRMTKLNKKTITKTFFSMFILTILMTCTPVYATEAANVVTAKFTAFQNLLGGIISSIGSIITLWGISEWGIAFQGSEGTMQANAFKRIGGGFVMAMAPQILSAIM